MPHMLKIRAPLRARAGFTLVEVIVALVLTAIIGASLTSVFVTQSMFFDVQEKSGSARAVSRSALNIMLSEMRMIEPGGGVVAATNTSITVRTPYAMGVICSIGTLASPRVTVSMLPADSAMFAEGDLGFSGYAYRTASGSYTYVDDATQKTPGKQVASLCAGATPPVRIVTNGGGNNDGFAVQFKLGLPIAIPLPAVGNVVFIYQEITYEFKASVTTPGQIGLWRRTEDRLCSGVPCEEELVAPFASTARFRFYVNDAATAQTAVPAALNTITGVELVLDGLSVRPRSDGTYQQSPMTTSVFFKNRP